MQEVKSKCIKEILLNMNKEIKNVKFLINPIECKSKQNLMKNIDEGKWAPNPLLGMFPLLPWCAPTPTLIKKEGKETRMSNREKGVLNILLVFQQHNLT
jgi:hypothetical protein